MVKAFSRRFRDALSTRPSDGKWKGHSNKDLESAQKHLWNRPLCDNLELDRARFRSAALTRPYSHVTVEELVWDFRTARGMKSSRNGEEWGRSNLFRPLENYT